MSQREWKKFLNALGSEGTEQLKEAFSQCTARSGVGAYCGQAEYAELIVSHAQDCGFDVSGDDIKTFYADITPHSPEPWQKPLRKAR